MTRPVRAAAALSFVLTLLVAVAVSAQTGGGGNTPPSFDPQSNRFTVAVIPDTQYLFDDDRGDTEPVTAAFNWLVANRASENIAFAAGLGDVTQDGLQNEVDRADHAYKILDRAKLPYSVLAGNHDINSGTNDTRPESPFSKAFGAHRYANMPTFLGASANGYNSAHRFTAGGPPVADPRARLAALHRRHGVGAVDPRRQQDRPDDRHHARDAGGQRGGQRGLTGYGTTLWNNLIRKNDQIILSLSGHNWPVARTTLKNDFGHDVSLNLADYQDMYYGGAGMIRTYAFDLDRNTIDVETFSPWVRARRRPTATSTSASCSSGRSAQSRYSLPSTSRRSRSGWTRSRRRRTSPPSS